MERTRAERKRGPLTRAGLTPVHVGRVLAVMRSGTYLVPRSSSLNGVAE